MTRNFMVLVGATAPSELSRVRQIVGNMPILIPGIGAQGGDIRATVKAGRDSTGNGMIINSSRGIIFAGDCSPVAIRTAALATDSEITLHRRRGNERVS